MNGDTQGARAVASGLKVQDTVRSHFALHGYTLVGAHSLDELLAWRKGLFPEAGCYAEQCKVPLIAPYQKHKGHSLVDFVVLTMPGHVVCLSIKSQQSDGTAEEKLEYEIQQLIATEQPAAMLVYGPIKGRDAQFGFREHVLQHIWDRTRSFGRNRVLLFRSVPKLSAWIEAGMPIAFGRHTATEIFEQYCDLEP